MYVIEVLNITLDMSEFPLGKILNVDTTEGSCDELLCGK